MKLSVQRLAGMLGYKTRGKPLPIAESPPETSLAEFRSDHYVRGNLRRLEHLSSLHIPVTGMTVLEVGAGIGDHTTYYLDRGCNVTITEGRAVNIEIMRRRFPGHKIVQLNMESPSPMRGGPFDVVHCYGLLYHLADPGRALQFMSDHCRKMLFLETCVSFGAGNDVGLVPEDRRNPSQSLSGHGCRPTRPWLFHQLQRVFPYVYCPKTQPNHEDFPLNWTVPEQHQPRSNLQRAIFIASRIEIVNHALSPELLDTQIRHE